MHCLDNNVPCTVRTFSTRPSAARAFAMSYNLLALVLNITVPNATCFFFLFFYTKPGKYDHYLFFLTLISKKRRAKRKQQRGGKEEDKNQEEENKNKNASATCASLWSASVLCEHRHFIEIKKGEDKQKINAFERWPFSSQAFSGEKKRLISHCISDKSRMTSVLSDSYNDFLFYLWRWALFSRNHSRPRDLRAFRPPLRR